MRYALSLLDAYLGSDRSQSCWSRAMWRFDSTEEALLVGVPGGLEHPGLAVIFGRNGGAWRQRRAILASDGAAGDGFGFQVAMEEDLVVVTAPFAARGVGAAYVYRWDGTLLVEDQKLRAADGTDGDLFGGSIDARFNRIIVGADRAYGSGCVHVFRRASSSWSLWQTLRPEDGSPGDEFGYSTSLDDNEIVVGAPSARGAGTVYLYSLRQGCWVQTQRLTAPEAGGTDFGRHVAHALDRPCLIVGGVRQDQEPIAYLFERSAGVWRAAGVRSHTAMR